MPDSRKKLYDAISNEFDLGTFEEFNSKMNIPESRKKLYESVSIDFDLGSFDEFESKVGALKKKEQTMPFDGQQFGGKNEEPLLPLTSSTVSPSVSKQPTSTIPLESTGAKSKQAPFQNVDISRPDLEVVGVKYDKVQERNRIQNYSQGLQKVQIDAAKKIKQRDDLFASIEQIQADLEASKSNPEQYNALIPQYNELVNNAKLLTNEISSDFNKIDIFEKGIGVTELKRQINEDTVGNRALEGVNNAARILLEAFPATVQVASYLTQRSRGIDPATAEKVSIDIAENGFPNIKRWSRELAEENEDLRSVFDQTTAWDLLTEKNSSLLEKDWAKIGELSAKELVQTLPATLAIMATYVNPIAGATTTIMGTAGMELEEMQGSNMTPDAKIANALTKGGLEYATEKVFGSIPMLKRAIGVKSKAGQEAYQNIVLETWNKFASKMGFAADVIEEVGSEMINTIGGNYTDYLSGKTTEADLYKGLGETFTTSLTMASTLSGAGRAAKYGNRKINELRSATKKLKEISESQETTPEVLQVIQDKVLENNEKIAEEAKKEKQAFDSMDDRTFSEATTLVQETQSLEQQLENNEVPEDVIPLVEEKIKKGYEKIDELSKQAKETNIEATGEVGGEVGKTENQIKVEELRVAEQAEKDATDPNDQEKLDEIYNRYDKLITPLLEKEGVKDYDGMFNPNKTGVSGLDDLLEDDGYNYFYKGVSGEVVMMSPDEYLKKVRTDITKTDRDEGIYEEKKEKIIEGINKGDKINMPYLSLKEDGKAHKQEGRNRATIAKERGEKLIPVFIEKDISFEDKVAKGQEYINSAIRDGATTKEEVLTKLKEQGLHRDAIRFIDENFDTKVGENKYEYDPKAKDSSGDIINGTDIEGTKESDITAGTNKGESSENVSVPTKEEVVQVETNKQQEDAVQEQTAGQVPVQPEAKVGEGVEGGKPKAEPKEATEEKQEEVAKKAGVSPKNLRDLYNVNRKLFGLDRVKSLASAIAMDRMIGAMAKRAGATKEQMYGRLKFEEGDYKLLLKTPNTLFQGTLDGQAASFITLPEGISIVDGWYSPIEKRLRETKVEKQSANKWLTSGLIGKGDEAIYTGVKGWLESKNPQEQVSKKEILDWMKDNRVEIVEVVKGNLEDLWKSAYKEKNQKFLQEVKDLEEYGISIYHVEGKRDFSDSVYKKLPKNIKNKLAELMVESDFLNAVRKNEGNAREVIVNESQVSRYSSYQLKGEKENYKEVLVTLPTLEGNKQAEYDNYYKSLIAKYGESGRLRYKISEEEKQKLDSLKPSKGLTFISSHFSEPNILVHLRMNTRTAADGSKVLFLEEVQSDWGQKGKKEGFADTSKQESIINQAKEKINAYAESNEKLGLLPMSSSSEVESFKRGNTEATAQLNKEIARIERYKDTVRNNRDWNAANEEIEKLENEKIKIKRQILENFKGIEEQNRIIDSATQDISRFDSLTTIAPFVTDTNAWAKLGLKIAMREAISQGVDKIAWTTGEQQNQRYDLRKQVDNINYLSNGDGTYQVYAKKDGNIIFKEKALAENKLESSFGKDVAEKIINDKGQAKEGLATKMLEGDDLAVGGKGMKGFYDKIIPDVAKALVKELTGQKVEIGETNINTTLYKENVIDSDFTAQQSIDITPELKAQVQKGMPLFQSSMAGAKGAMQAMADGTYVVYALTDPNVSTPLHELAHVFEHYLTDAEKNAVMKAAGTKEWNIQTSEYFARGFEKYLAEGKSPVPALDKLFAKFKEWLTEIYNGIKGSDIDIKLNKPMRDIYASMLGEKIEGAKFPDNISKIAKELNLSPQQIQNTYKKYDGSKKIEDITLEDYNKARAKGNKTKLENSKKAFEFLLVEESLSPTAQKKAAKSKENLDDKALKSASKMMENIDEIRQQLLNAGVIKSINCKWG